jgi:hypothetical protein
MHCDPGDNGCIQSFCNGDFKANNSLLLNLSYPQESWLFYSTRDCGACMQISRRTHCMITIASKCNNNLRIILLLQAILTRWETAIYYWRPRQRINPSLKFQRQAAMDLVAWRDQTPKHYRAWMSSRRTQTQPPHPCHWSQCNGLEDDPIELEQDPKSLTLSEQLPCEHWRLGDHRKNCAQL